AEELLAGALLESARAIGATPGPWGAFLSGGTDSSTATSMLRPLHSDVRTYTLGTPFGGEYGDAENVARFLGVANTRVLAGEADAASHFDRAVFSNETIDGLTAETLAQLGILAEAASRDVKRVITGYGSDLLFGAMLRHEMYMKLTAVSDQQA